MSMSRALQARGCYSVAMETRQRQKWRMMEVDGWSMPEVEVNIEVCVCVFVSVWLCACMAADVYLCLLLRMCEIAH